MGGTGSLSPCSCPACDAVSALRKFWVLGLIRLWKQNSENSFGSPFEWRRNSFLTYGTGLVIICVLGRYAASAVSFSTQNFPGGRSVRASVESWAEIKSVSSDLGSNPFRLSFLFKSCGRWTLSCDFVPHSYETLKWLSSLPTR